MCDYEFYFFSLITKIEHTEKWKTDKRTNEQNGGPLSMQSEKIKLTSFPFDNIS